MVDITNIQTIFQVPSSFSTAMKQYVGQLIIDQIRRNTSKGISATGGKFPKYSNEYKNSLDFQNAGKTSKVNLELTGDMLASIEIIKINPSSVVVGYSPDSEFAAQCEGNQIGSYGNDPNPAKARPFLGLPSEQLKQIINKVQSEMGTKNQSEVIEENIKKQQSIINSLLSRFLTQ